MRNWIAKQGVRRTEPEFELRYAVEQRGCPICRLVRRTAVRQLDILAYEAVNDLGVRAKLRASRGFCLRHAWQFLEETRDPLGTALIHRDIINTLAARASGEDPDQAGFSTFVGRILSALRRPDASRLAARLAPSAECPTCVSEKQTADLYHGVLNRQLQENPDFVEVWRHSDGLCWPHLREVLSDRATARVFDGLIEPWLTRFGGSRPRARGDLVDVAAAAYGLVAAPRDVLPAELVVDVQQRRLASAVRPDCAGEPDCAICRASESDARRRVASADSAAVLCPAHGWESIFAGGIPDSAWAVTLDSLCSRRSHEIRGNAAGRSDDHQPSREIGRWHFKSGCPTCDTRLASFRAAIARSVGSGSALDHPLCLGHLLLALGDESSGRWVISGLPRQIAAWREVSADLAEYIRKQDYRFRHEPRGDEQASPWRGVDLVAGPNWLLV